MVIFSQSDSRKRMKGIVAGQYLGMGIIVAFSIFAAYVINLIPQAWVIGLLGLIPLFLGIRVALKREEREDEDVLGKMEARGTNQLFWAVALITVASGGDNLGIYIPYFASLTWPETVVALNIFTVSIAILCYISYKMTKIPFISKTIGKYQRVVVSMVFIGLGMYILFENGTIQTLLGL